MTNDEMLVFLQNAEKTLDIQKFKYKDIDFWPFLRVMLYAENSGRNGHFEIRKIGIAKKISFVFSSLFECFFDRKKHSPLKTSDIYILTASNSRYLLDNKSYFDTFVSPLVEWTTRKYHIDELIPVGDYRLPRSEKTAFIQHNVYLKYLQASFLFKSDPSVNSWVSEWNKLCNLLLDNNYKTDFNIRSIENRIKQLHFLSLWFVSRLKKIKPKIILVMCYYTTPGFALMYAANMLGIKTIDLQHGVQGKKHVAYSIFCNIPKNGWDLLPDVFWNWTKKDADYINSWGEDKHVGLEGGIIWHQYLKNTPELNKNWFTKLDLINDKNKPYILVTFQLLKDNQNFINSIIDIIKSKKGQNFFWLLRLHPGMLDQLNEYKQIFNISNCDVEVATSVPLPLILEKLVLHISRYSSVVIEAAMYGVPSFVEQGRNYFCEYEEDKKIVYFSDDLLEKFLDQKIGLLNNEKRQNLLNSFEVWKNLVESHS